MKLIEHVSKYCGVSKNQVKENKTENAVDSSLQNYHRLRLTARASVFTHSMWCSPRFSPIQTKTQSEIRPR